MPHVAGHSHHGGFTSTKKKTKPKTTAPGQSGGFQYTPPVTNT